MNEKNDQMNQSELPKIVGQNQPLNKTEDSQVVKTLIEFGESCPYLMAELDYYLERVGTKVDYGNERCKKLRGIFVSEIISNKEDAKNMVQRLNRVYQNQNNELFNVVKSSTKKGFRIQVSFHLIEDYYKVNEMVFEKVYNEFNRSFSFKINDDVTHSNKFKEVKWEQNDKFPTKFPIFFGINGSNYNGRPFKFVQNTLTSYIVEKGFCQVLTNQIPQLFEENFKLVAGVHKTDEYYLEPKASVKIVYGFNRFKRLPAQLKINFGPKAFEEEVGAQIIENITTIVKDVSRLIAKYLSPEDIGRLSQLNKATWAIENSFFKKGVASSTKEQESSNNSTPKRG